MRNLRPLAAARGDGRLLIALLILLAAIRVAATWRVFSQTIDEPIHVHAGFQWLSEHTYDVDIEHPPLARVLCALGPWLAGGDGTFVWYSRAGNLPFLILTLVIVALWTRRMYGDAAAVVAVALLSAMPPLLAHAGLSTTDIAATAMTVTALYAFERWLEVPSWPRALLLALACGIGMVSKFSFPVFFGIGAIVILVASGKWRLPLSQLAAIAAIVVLTIWAMYFFSIGRINGLRAEFYPATSSEAIAAKYASTPGYDWVRADLIDRYHTYAKLAADRGVSGIDFVDWAKAAGYPSPLAGRHGNTMRGAPPLPKPSLPDRLLEPVRPIGQWITVHAPLPAPSFVAGMMYVSRHTTIGQPSFLLGRVGNYWWYYFPVLIFFKTPIAFLILCWKWLTRPFAIAVAMLIPPMISALNIGLRHVLPIYPFLAMAAAIGVVALWRRQRVVVIVLLAWFFVATSIAHPDYLAYFNEFAGRHPERIAVDSNLDWGQDLLRLARAVREEKVDRLKLAYFGSADPRRQLPCAVDDLGPNAPATGWIAISETILQTDAGYAWLKREKPVRRVGKSIELYHVRDARTSLPAVRAGSKVTAEGGRHAQSNFLAGMGDSRRPPAHLRRPDHPHRQPARGRALEVGRSARRRLPDRQRAESRRRSEAPPELSASAPASHASASRTLAIVSDVQCLPR